MLFRTIDEFYLRAEEAERLTREEERRLYAFMLEGDREARDKLVDGYLHIVAAYIRRLPPELAALNSVYSALAMLEGCVDEFNFTSEGESFSHRLSLKLRGLTTTLIANS